MASGFKSVHPLTEQVLRDLGVQDEQVTQGWGYAAASAGFHAPEGTYAGRRYSSCVDIAWTDEFCNAQWRSRATAAGLCPFFRDWAGNQHIHIVHVGLRDDGGKVRILDGPRMQIVDYIHGLNGLVGHAPLEGWQCPSAAERELIRQAYAAWAPYYQTAVYDPDGLPVRCYAWEGKVNVTVEVRPVLERLGCRIIDSTSAGLIIRTDDGKLLAPPCDGFYVAGEFLRGPIRKVVEPLGKYIVDAQWDDEVRGSRVYIRRQ
jgi:hypothetical protein